MKELVVRPVGFVRSPFREKVEAPRQGTAPGGAAGTVELLSEYKDALADLDGFDRIWLVFWFDRAEGWRPKVLPPRSEDKRGVFATRSPHRPNAIGMTAVRLERVDGLVLHVHDLDLVDGTPVLDIKPYIPYADAFPEAKSGWLEAPDARAAWTVDVEPAAALELAWIATETGKDLRARVEAALSLGPQPHAYRRIKETPDGGRVLAVKEWRARFRVEDEARRIVVERVLSGYRPREIEQGREPVHAVHRAFVERFGAP
ncbi:MAG: tRNA (N6-threonylcarbamoyladenosine(37)-N6)-methyltransferase TrmO [Labilithrix sp.]|nr:tRNA (N6-threonylcarbamoyladenosine(37)-N6)-methyltransferase TrmO [Labilithrix sp.]